MNTETDNNGSDKLQGAFGDKGTNVNAMSFGHPYAEDIIAQAKDVINESKTGASLISVHTHHKIPIQVIKGNGPSGFNPQSRIIYLQVPSKIKEADGKIVLNLIKGLREADQEMIGFTAPDPSKDLMEYATVMHSKALDAIIYICKFVNELTNSSHFPVLLDSLEQLGHIKVYKAYEKDASKEELFDAYAGL